MLNTGRACPTALTIIAVVTVLGAVALGSFAQQGPRGGLPTTEQRDQRPTAVPPVGGQSPAVPAPPPTASIAGMVTAVGSSDPIVGASVEARRSECGSTSGESATAMTGPDGRFRLERLRAGPWCVGASHPSGTFTPAEYQQRSFMGRGVAATLADGQALDNINLNMAPTGSISGTVLDDDGEPMARVRVQVMRATYRDGTRRLYSMNVVQTNDLGEFNFFWLPPDRYFVAAIPEDTDRPSAAYSVAPPGNGGYRADTLPPVIRRRTSSTGEKIEETYAPVYYGGGADSTRARPIDIGPAETINSIQLTFNGAKTRAWHIRGKVPPIELPPAAPAPAGRGGQQNPPAPPAAQLRLAPRDWTSIVVMPFATADRDGKFDIAGVAPGSYVLYATVQNQTARIPIEIGNANIEELRVVLAPPFRLSGRLSVDNPATLTSTADLPGLRIALARNPDLSGVPGVSATAGVTTQSVFTLANVPPGDYSVYATPILAPATTARRSMPKAFENSYVKSIQLAGQDVLREGLHLTGATDALLEVALGLGGSLSGTVTDTELRPAAVATVVLVPDGSDGLKRTDLFRVTGTDRTGRFQIKGIAPGGYRAFAWDDVADGAWFDEEFIRSAAGGARPVFIGEGMESATDLQLTR